MADSSQLFLAALFGARKKLIDPAFELVGTIDLKIQFRRTAQVKPLGERMPDIVLRRIQSLERALGLDLVPLHIDQYTRGTGVVRHQHDVDAGQADAGIGELTLEDGFNLLADSPAQALPMMSDCPAFQSRASMKENLPE